MSRRIIGVTVGTPLSPNAVMEKLKPVTSVNGVEADENGNVQIETGGNTPVFDLAALGLSAIPLTGGSAYVETNTVDICAALDNGAVTFVIPFEMSGATIQANLTMVSASLGDDYQCISVVNLIETATITVNVSDTAIMVECSSIKEAVADTPPTSIDLSGFESEGRIVETFADGSTATTVMEFDANGKPTKITDGSGNVTVLTW